ncbi:MAG: hypothetical protein GY832_40745 [Chloroflexi bacterium]|nr:hypothetical protein [Chloroflexota bacterium]
MNIDEYHYQIRVKGQLLPDQWRDWFGNMTVALQDNGDTQLDGPLPDQAALHGVLNRIRDLGLTLVYLRCLELTEALS